MVTLHCGDLVRCVPSTGRYCRRCMRITAIPRTRMLSGAHCIDRCSFRSEKFPCARLGGPCNCIALSHSRTHNNTALLSSAFISANSQPPKHATGHAIKRVNDLHARTHARTHTRIHKKKTYTTRVNRGAHASSSRVQLLSVDSGTTIKNGPLLRLNSTRYVSSAIVCG